mgnify:CR=1 FL=1
MDWVFGRDSVRRVEQGSGLKIAALFLRSGWVKLAVPSKPLLELDGIPTQLGALTVHMILQCLFDLLKFWVRTHGTKVR